MKNEFMNYLLENFNNLINNIKSLFIRLFTNYKIKLNSLLEKEDTFIISNGFCNCKDIKIFNIDFGKIKCKLCSVKRVIDFEKEEDIYFLLNNLKDKANFIIHTDGGTTRFADFLPYIINQRNIFLRSYIPEFALSAGSFIALASNIICLNWYSCMGPVDTRLDYSISDDEEDIFSAKHIKLVKKKENAITELKALEAESFHNDDMFIINKIFKNKKKRDDILKNFLNTNKSHYVKYGQKDLEKFGLKVKIGINKNIMEIFELFKKLKN